MLFVVALGFSNAVVQRQSPDVGVVVVLEEKQL